MKDAYYFSHDSNARFDSKIIKLRTKFGLEGYGFYFCMLEIMRDNSEYIFDLNDIETLQIQLQIPLEKIKIILDYCIEIDLFTMLNNCVFSESFIKRMGKMNVLRANKIRAGRLGGIAQAKGKQNSSKTQANVKQNASKIDKEKKGKEKKGKEIKRKENEIILGEFKNIFLSENELEKLKSLYGHKFDEAIGVLSSYIESSGKVYKSCYAVLCSHNWVYQKVIGNTTNQREDTPYNAYA